jgi:predicted MFS family arabinose efflux permease
MPDVQREFHVNDARAGLLATYFLISYSIFGVVTGYLGDRMRRTYLLGVGIGIWSLATFGSGLARSYNQLALARSMLGIGEATYGVIAPTILLDLFGRQERARVLSWFYVAMPLGTALGTVIGGYVADRYSWHMAFFVVGVPAVLAAAAAPFLPEPVRGASEGVEEGRLRAQEQAGASREDYRDLMVNSSYTYSVFGMTAYTFAIGGLLVWVPSFLISTRGMPKLYATSRLGLVTLFAALAGMSIGGWASDRLARTNPRALFVVPGLAMLASIPFLLVAMLARDHATIFAGIFLAEALMFVNTGPCNAIIGHVVAPNMRAAAYAIAIASQHFLGDIWSPWLIGEVSVLCGKADTMASAIGPVLTRLGAVPTRLPGYPEPRNLLAGLLIVVPAVFLSGLVLLTGARHLPREMALMLARLRATPRSPAATPPPTTVPEDRI